MAHNPLITTVCKSSVPQIGILQTRASSCFFCSSLFQKKMMKMPLFFRSSREMMPFFRSSCEMMPFLFSPFLPSTIYHFPHAGIRRKKEKSCDGQTTTNNNNNNNFFLPPEHFFSFRRQKNIIFPSARTIIFRFFFCPGVPVFESRVRSSSPAGILEVRVPHYFVWEGGGWREE